MKLIKWLAKDDKLKGAEIFTSVLTLSAGAVWVYLDGFTGETIAQVTATLGTASVILFTVINKIKRQNVTNFVESGKKALSKLQKEHPSILIGPRYSNRNANRNEKKGSMEETPADERKYLFFQREGEGQEAQFIPVIPFKQAIVAIYLGSWALRIATKGSVAPSPTEVEQVKTSVKNAIKVMAERDFSGKFEDVEFDPKKNENLCIYLGFDDEKISEKVFESAVYKIGKTALGAITSAKKGENNGSIQV